MVALSDVLATRTAVDHRVAFRVLGLVFFAGFRRSAPVRRSTDLPKASHGVHNLPSADAENSTSGFAQQVAHGGTSAHAKVREQAMERRTVLHPQHRRSM